jgi:hypothetical protein
MGGSASRASVPREMEVAMRLTLLIAGNGERLMLDEGIFR